MVWADDMAKVDLAMTETERLITQEDCVVIIGGWWSSLTYPIQEVCARYKVVNLCYDSSSPTLLERGYEWFFMAWPHDDFFGMKQVEFLIELIEKKGLKDDVKTVGVMVESALFGQTAGSSWKKYIQKAVDEGRVDWEIVEDITFAAPVVDVTPEVLKMKAADPDLLFMCPMAPADCVKMMTAMMEQDYYPPITMTMDAGFTMWDYWQIEEMRKESMYFFSRFGAGNLMDQIEKVPKLKEIYDLWMEEFDYFEFGVLSTYMGVLSLKEALEEAGRNDPNREDFTTAIRDAFRTIYISREEAGMYGVDFNDETGFNDLCEILIGQNLPDPKNPGDVDYQTVWPWELAVTDVIIPDPRSRGLG